MSNPKAGGAYIPAAFGGMCADRATQRTHGKLHHVCGTRGYGVYLEPTGRVILDIDWDREGPPFVKGGQRVVCDVDGLKARCGALNFKGKIEEVQLASRWFR